jgi:hypothetical protein
MSCALIEDEETHTGDATNGMNINGTFTCVNISVSIANIVFLLFY